MTDTTERAPPGATDAVLPVADLSPDLAAIRGRVALVVATFTRATGGFPDPMTPDEAAAALAFTDDDLDHPIGGPVVPFALRWGVSLDWLLMGDIGALLSYARTGFHAEREQRAAS